MAGLRRLILAAALAGAACGGDDGSTPAIDARPPDAPPAGSFTDYVIDLVLQPTASDTEPRPFAEFADLVDPDLDNPDAYAPLFP